MFSPLFYHYGEDKDFVNRLSYYNLKLGYTPAYCGCHDREYRLMTRDKFFYMESTYFLSVYANINLLWGIAFAKSVLAAVKKAIICLFRLKMEDSITYFKISSNLLLKSLEVYRTRKQSRNVNLNNYTMDLPSVVF